MGTWSTSIIGNDSSLDVYDDFMKQYYDAVPLEIIKQNMLDKYSLDENCGVVLDDMINYWLGYAWALNEVKLLSKKMALIVKSIIESGKDLQSWKELGASESSLRDRAIETQNFLDIVLKQAEKPNPKDVISKRKKKKKEKEYYSELKAGEIFKFPMYADTKEYFKALKTDNLECKEWGYGRVILNEYYQKSNREKFEHNKNYTYLWRNGIWVELYKETTKLTDALPSEFTVLVPNLLVLSLSFMVVGYKAVEVEKVVFRETIANRYELFIGELRIKFPDTHNTDDINICPGSSSCALFANIIWANTNRLAEVIGNADQYKLENIDFRFHPLREAILQSANIPINYNYAELALSYGIDLKRLYIDAQFNTKKM